MNYVMQAGPACEPMIPFLTDEDPPSTAARGFKAIRIAVRAMRTAHSSPRVKSNGPGFKSKRLRSQCNAIARQMLQLRLQLRRDSGDVHSAAWSSPGTSGMIIWQLKSWQSKTNRSGRSMLLSHRQTSHCSQLQQPTALQGSVIRGE